MTGAFSEAKFHHLATFIISKRLTGLQIQLKPSFKQKYLRYFSFYPSVTKDRITIWLWPENTLQCTEQKKKNKKHSKSGKEELKVVPTCSGSNVAKQSYWGQLKRVSLFSH